MTLSLPVVQVRDLAPGETVGYGNTWAADPRARASRPSRAATPTGSSARSRSRAVRLAWRHALPVVGRVSMDLITVDITHLDADPARLDILGPFQSVDDLADDRGHHRLRDDDLARHRYRGATSGSAHEPPVAGARLGRRCSALLAVIGRIALFAGQTVWPPWCARPSTPKELGQPIWFIGYFSLPVVGLTAIFTGGALALQIYAGGARFNAEAVVPSIVAIGMVRELGPVLGGLMVAAPRGLLHRGRDRHDEGDRADRRAGHAVHQPDQVPRRAARASRRP